MRIGIYGGSFNPPHNGHVMLANKLQQELSLDRIIIIPSNISPQKDNNGHIDPLHRLQMCRLAFDAPCFTVSDCEINRGGKSYTVDTLAFLRTCYPDADFTLFMGSDMLLSFHTWYRWRDILNECEVCAVSRQQEDSPEEMRRYVAEELQSDRVTVFDCPPFAVSSSEIREKLGRGEDCKALLPETVFTYIKEHQLYGFSNL